MQKNENPQIVKLREEINKVNKNQQWILDNLIFFSRSGSFIYGTNHPKSDEDHVGITIAPEEYWIGNKTFLQFQIGETTIYDIRRYLNLAVESNPNIIEFLFIPQNNPNVIIYTDYWDKIISLREKIISKKVLHTFKGYSHSQRQKLILKQNNKTGRRYITDEFNYDTKFLMHAFRLLEEGVELLKTNKITFPRPNAQELLDIRMGKSYSHKHINEAFEKLDKLEQDLISAEEKSTLPYSGDKELINRLYIETFKTKVTSV